MAGVREPSIKAKNETDSLEHLREMLRFHAPCGIDYFIYQKGTFVNMPDFLIARQSFDCAITGYAIKKRTYFRGRFNSSCFCYTSES